MSNCHGCYWADRHPETRVQNKHFEPDFLSPNIKPGGSPPDVRIVQSCGAGAHFYKTFGAQEHNCSHFIDEAETAEEEGEDIERRRQEWTYPTSRQQLPVTQNMLLIIERMAAKNNEAFDILLELMSVQPEEMAVTITCLDDMNIRGAQIVIAYKYCKESIASLMAHAKKRDAKMVAYVNANYKFADKEQAVTRGAHLYGHNPK